MRKRHEAADSRANKERVKERSTLEIRLREAETKRRSVLDTVKRTLTGEDQVEEPVEVKK